MNLTFFIAVLFAAISSVSISSAGQTTQATRVGSVCVLPNSAEPPDRFSPGGQYNPATLNIRIDNRETLHSPHKERLLLNDLDLQEKHLVVLTSDAKRIQSFRFKFSPEDDAKVCVYFDGYGGVQLGNVTNALWCRAERKRCWH
jgi:hypothetical protein